MDDCSAHIIVDRGGGNVGPGLDSACYAHDSCYKLARVGVWDNWNLNLPAEKQDAISRCNQNLCDTAEHSAAAVQELLIKHLPTLGKCTRAVKKELDDDFKCCSSCCN